MAPTELLVTDCETVLSEIKRQEELLKLKRRWLIGLPTSKSKSKQIKEPKFLKKFRSLPESMLREDDIFYETIKTRVEELFGACTAEKEYNVQDDVKCFDAHSIKRILISCLDALNNKGLYRIAMMLTGGSIKFEKTRQKMKMFIKEYISKDFRNQNHQRRTDILKQLSLLLNDSLNYRENCVTLLTPTVQSHHGAVIKVLAGLENLPFQALFAMHKKLRGVTPGMPHLHCHRHGRSRGHIIEQIRKHSKKMLSELNKVDELQEPLAKAMAVAGLSLRLKPGFQKSSETVFLQFSPEIKSLQNEIVKAIWLLQTKVRFPELKTLQHLLDPNAVIPNGYLRTAVKKMLIEYLFECSDMDTIPKSLLEALAFLNRDSRSTPYRCFPKEEIEKEVECVLSVSAQMKQIFWDLLPECGLDQEFADAYMEELEESDDGDDCDDHNNRIDGDFDIYHRQLAPGKSNSRSPVESDHELEGIGESMPVDSRPLASATRENGSSAYLTPNERSNRISAEGLEREHYSRLDSDPHSIISSSQFLESRTHSNSVKMDIDDSKVETMGKVCSSRSDGNSYSQFLSPKGRLKGNLFLGHEVEANTRRDPVISRDLFSSSYLYEDIKAVKQIKCRNPYLAIQEICDNTSLVAYDLIGQMLEKFAKEDEVELDLKDRLYLRGNSSTEETAKASGEKRTSEEDLGSSVVQIVEGLTPSLSKSGIKKLKKLMHAK